MKTAFFVLLVGYLQISDATICKPLSVFKMDCNACRCSLSGTEYSCTTKICPPPSHDEFLREYDERGYVLLKPKATSRQVVFDDNSSIKSNSRKTRIPKNYPYLNDEIPNSREFFDNENDVDNRNEINNKNDWEDEDSFITDLEEAKEANRHDNEGFNNYFNSLYNIKD